MPEPPWAISLKCLRRSAQQKAVVAGSYVRSADASFRVRRIDSDADYPTDSSLLGHSVRVLTRTMKRIAELAGAAGAKPRDRSRSVKRRLLEIGRAVRSKAMPNRERLVRAYGRLIEATVWVVGQAKRFSQEIGAGIKRCTAIIEQAILDGLRQTLDDMIPMVRQMGFSSPRGAADDDEGSTPRHRIVQADFQLPQLTLEISAGSDGSVLKGA
jgi:hypothetical protein